MLWSDGFGVKKWEDLTSVEESGKLKMLTKLEGYSYITTLTKNLW